MAGVKISELTLDSSPTGNNYIETLDVDDTTMSPAGTNKKTLISSILSLISGATGANPTGTIGLSTVNGSALTFLRSDGTPPLSQAIAPTWTAQHIFQASSSSVIKLIVKGVSSQSANLIEFQNNSGTTLAYIGPTGKAGFVNSTSSGTTEPWLDVESEASSTGLVARIKRTGETSISFKFLGGTTAYIIASNRIAICYGDDVAKRIFDIDGINRRVVFLTGGGSDEPTNMPANGVGIGRDLPLYGLTWSSTTEGRARWQITGDTIDNTDASRKYRMVLSVWDTSAREFIRADGDGSYAITSIGGVAATSTTSLTVGSPTATYTTQITKGATSQSANLSEWQSSAGTVYATYSENGYCTTRKNSAPADAELANGEAAYWFDSTNGAAKFMIKAKTADGTVVTGSINLT